MLIRTFLIRVGVLYDDKGMADAKRDAKDLGTTAEQAKRPVDGLEKSLDETADSAKDAGAAAAKAGKQIKGAGTQAATAGKQVGRFEGLIGKAGAALAALGPALAAAGLAGLIAGVGKAISFVSEQTAILDKVSKDAQKTGFAIEDIQKLTQVATLSGSAIEIVTKGISNLNIQLDVVSRGGAGPAAEAMDELGLTFEDLKDKDPTEQLAIVARALEGIESPAEKSLVAFKLMGEEGKDLIPLFNSGADAIGDMTDSVGKIFTREDLNKAEAYQDALAGLDKAISFVAGSLAVGLAPTLEKGIALFERAIPPITAFFEGLFNKVAPAFERFVEAARPWVERLGPDAAERFTALQRPIELAADVVIFFVEQISFLLNIGDKLLTWIDDVSESLETRWPRAWAVAGAAVDLVVSPLETARKVAAEVLDFVERTVGGVGDLAARVKSIRGALGLGTGEAGAGVAGSAIAAGAGITSSAGTQQANAAARARNAEQEQARRAASRAGQREAGVRTEAGILRRRAARRPRGGGGGGSGPAEDAHAGFLADLGLEAPAAAIAGRPLPETLTIVIAPTIKLIESMTITVTGASGPEQQRAFESAADQAKDAIFVRLSELPALVVNMFKLERKALQTAGGGGRSLPGDA